MSAESELAVIGGCLQDGSLFAALDLAPEDFSQLSCRRAWEAMMNLRERSEPIDVITVAEELERLHGDASLQHLVAWADAATLHNLDTYAQSVQRSGKLRSAAQIGARLQEATLDEAAIDESIRDLMQLAVTRKRYAKTAQDLARAVVEYLDDVQQGRRAGITTGLADLDHSIGGFRAGDLYVLGARPAMGKTAWLLGRAEAAGVPVGIISAEQGHDQVGLRLVAIRGQLNAHRLRLGDLREHEWPRLSEVTQEIARLPIWVNDQPAPTLQTIVRQARQWQHEQGIQALYVDYIQRLKGSRPDDPRHQQVADLVMGLKELARELGIPVVALSQVNRNVEARTNKRPGLADLKDSGAIEQEADVVMTLYREEVYDEDSAQKGIAEIDVLKNRHGPTGVVRVAWRGECMRFDALTMRVA